MSSTVAAAHWDRRLECYLRERGITTLVAVVCPLTFVPEGVVHLLDGTQADEVGRLLTAHPDVVEVDSLRSPKSQLLHFRVRDDLTT